MSVITLIYTALGLLMVSGVLAALLRFSTPLSGLVAGLGGALGSLAMLLAGGSVLLGLADGIDVLSPLGRWPLHLSALNALWLVTLGLTGTAVGLYTIGWQRHADARPEGLLLNLVLAAALLATVAGHLAMMVAMCEVMALGALFLTGNSASAKLWFVLGRLGTLLLAVMCLLLWQRYGTLEIAPLQAQMRLLPLGGGIWLLGLVGFGLLAGIVPLHGWVAQAHAQASAPAAALFSAVVVKVGIYGLLTVSLLDPALPRGCSLLVLVLGVITAFIGGLYALLEHNVNRLLAYHTVENIGIILLGLGAGLLGISLQDPLLVALGMVGGLYHLFNHSLFKTTLLLGAGAVWYRTGERDIEKLGGLGKRMPLVSLAMLIGLMSMAALPPLSGFAGEWVIYQSLFRLGTSEAFVARLLGPLLATGLAITGALAVMCMAKVYGVTFLGAPRTDSARTARPAPWLLSLPTAALALCAVAGGVAAPWLLPLLDRAVPLPLVTNNTTVSPPGIALLLIAGTLLPFIVLGLTQRGRLAPRTRGAAWVCGYQHEAAMVITAHGFARPVHAAFAPLVALRHRLNPVRLLPGWQAASLPMLCRRMAFIELAVLLVVVISQGA